MSDAHDSTITKIDSRFSPTGPDGQVYLASGTSVAMRMWLEDEPAEGTISVRDYEAVGYVIAGRARLEIEGQTVLLAAGDSWVVPRGAEHRYVIEEPFTAVEATHPPAHAHGRDA